MKKLVAYLALAVLLVLISGVARAAPPVPGMLDVGYEVVSSSTVIPANVIVGTASVSCPSGKVVLGGGAKIEGDTNPLASRGIVESRPIANSGWTAESFGEQNNAVRTLTVWAICANA